MLPSRALLLGATLLALLAGCVAPAAEETGDPAADPASIAADWWTKAIPSLLDDANHSHADRAQHAGLTTPNFEVVGWDPLTTATYGETLTGMGCGGAQTRADGRRLAIVHSISTDVSFVVADVTDPEAPQMMGEYYMPNAVVWDADITADGMHVLVGAYPYVIGGVGPPTLPPAGQHASREGLTLPELRSGVWKPEVYYTDACTGVTTSAGPESYLPFGPGIVMVGIQDPATPTFEDWVPQPVVGPHSVSSYLVDGTLFATASTTNLNHEASYYSIFTVEGPKLVPYTVIQAPGVRSTASPLDNGHVDVAIGKHPVTGATLAYLANWNAGMSIYDISLPGPAREVATWMDGDAGSVHTTYLFPELVDDRVLMVVGQEVGEPEALPSGWVYILDVTDPAAPTELGRWTLPVKVPWGDVESEGGGLNFSPHYVAVLDDTLFVSNYHGGLWALDIADPTAPVAIGLFVPEREPPMPFGGDAHGPTIEDVIVDPETRILTTWDNAGGVYQLRFDATNPAPPAPAWPVEG